jgi:hypothetical protein
LTYVHLSVPLSLFLTSIYYTYIPQRAHQQRAAAGPGVGASVEKGGAGSSGNSSEQRGSGGQPPLLDPSAAPGAPAPSAADDEEQLALLESLPDYPRDAPQHQIKERHVGWDGALEGYTLGDGTYVSVKVSVPYLSAGCMWAVADVALF